MTSDLAGCLSCGLDHVMKDLTDSETLLIISSSVALASPTSSASVSRLLEEVETRRIPIFLISFPSQSVLSSRSIGTIRDVVKYGGVFAVEQSNLIQAAVMTILGRVDRIHSLALHHSRHLAGTGAESDQSDNRNQFSGQFVLAEQREATLRLTLTLPDEEKVEYFEVENPRGERKILSKFEDGMVYFTFSGLLPTGLWKYRAKLYTDTEISAEDVVTVDAVLTSHQELGFTTRVLLTEPTESEPVRIVAEVRAGASLVTGATVSALVLLPDSSEISVPLVDNGLGYPDITAGDGLYSGYLPRLAASPGFYSALVRVDTEPESAGVAETRLGAGDCCGRSVPSVTRASLAASQQQSLSTSLYLRSSAREDQEDAAPPNRISDLVAASQDNLIRLTWTAPGGDWNYGRGEICENFPCKYWKLN